MSTKRVFICGTDTGIGKTVVTQALLSWCDAKGKIAVPFKPFESGCSPLKKGMKRHLKRGDTEALRKFSSIKLSADEINVYAFEEALAPGVAALRSRQKVSFTPIKKALSHLEKQADTVFIEGAGGLLVPLWGKKTSLDLLKYLKTPVVLVARLGLGTLNHTLLTLEHLKRNKVPVLGVILNENVKKSTVADATNERELIKLGVPILGVFPYTKNRSKAHLARLVEKSLNVKKLKQLFV